MARLLLLEPTCVPTPRHRAAATPATLVGKHTDSYHKAHSDICRCCPASYSCAAPQGSNGLIGCCPNGNSCGGAVNVASVTTVTVQAVQQTSVVYVPPTTSFVVVGQATSAVPYQGGFCSTLTASGPGLPTTRQGDCGVILVVNHGPINFKALGYGTGAILIGLHLAVRRMFH
jgi:hypothetical protein